MVRQGNSAPLRTYTTFEPRYRHTTVFLDRETETWFMYQSTDREEDGNHIVVRTAPAVPVARLTSHSPPGTFSGARVGSGAIWNMEGMMK